MDQEVIALKWNRHLSSLSSLLHTLRTNETFVDVTLACDGRTFSAHKLVLAMCSDYFREIFAANSCQHPVVFLSGVSCADVEALLDFMYKGETHIAHHALPRLARMAEELKIKGLGLFAQENNGIPDDDSGSGVQYESGQEDGTDPPEPPVDAVEAVMEEPALSEGDHHDISRVLDTELGSRDSNCVQIEDSFVLTDNEGTEDGYVQDEESTLPKGEWDINDPQRAKKRKNVKLKNGKRIKLTAIASASMQAPELPRIGENALELGEGVTIGEAEYARLRRDNANHYIKDLLFHYFPQDVLIASSLTGSKCCANKVPSKKKPLDARIISAITDDIIRNFPSMSVADVREGIRRKLNSLSTQYRRHYRPKGVKLLDGTMPEVVMEEMEDESGLSSFDNSMLEMGVHPEEEQAFVM